MVDLVVPETCSLCGAEPSNYAAWSVAAEPSAVVLCDDCLALLATDVEYSCPGCAAPLPAIPELPCPYCRERRYRFSAAVTLGLYRGRLRQAVLKMKYGAHESLTLSMGELLVRRVMAAGWERETDLVVPVPLQLWKRLVRGASAPELLAEVVSLGANIPVAPRLLRCRRATRKQGTLSPGERLVNMREAFGVASCYDIRGARVLLIDDVMTTGATVNDAARALLEAGAVAVRVAVVARGTGQGSR